MPLCYGHIAMREMLAPYDPFPSGRIGLVDEAVEAGLLTVAEIDRLAIPRKTLAHRRALGHLTPEQADRMDRLLRMVAMAEETFANREKAAVWLRRSNQLFGGKAPLDLLETDRGCRMVEDLLARISHGIAA